MEKYKKKWIPTLIWSCSYSLTELVTTCQFVLYPKYSGGAKKLCILCHRAIRLILAYSWARPAILAADKGRGGMFYFFCFFTSIPVPLSSLFLSFISTVSSLPFSGRQHKMTHKGWCVVKPHHNQTILNFYLTLIKTLDLSRWFSSIYFSPTLCFPLTIGFQISTTHWIFRVTMVMWKITTNCNMSFLRYIFHQPCVSF